MSAGVWIGLAASIPIGIGTSLVAPDIRRWMDRHLTIRTLKQAQRTSEDYLKVASFYQNPELLSHYLLETILKMLVLGVLAIVMSVFWTALILHSGYLSPFKLIASSVVLALGALLILLCVEVLTTYSRDALTIAHNVHNMKEYIKKVPEDIQQKLESAIDTLRRPKS